ncbi:iron-siderophore ABC transporter substrate-binding protein [Paenibacillus barcinonensis]|uniref:ABC transporter substrate-binding protein n=1 Tax=Paenibacillus barcinonensis TaxID=198119 RepID=UPI001C11328D|nr:iron-siderophore ABC transporter substrate-binding protein [Paenibacillus barcinonensis]MBU5352594.1 iron-siderophore ABC transporter substrate-binding protein [Paenibacillus barcinonensis]
MRFKVGSYFMVLISTLVLMAGCTSSPDEKTATHESTTASSDEVRTFTHPLGTLELKGTPKRIVTLDFNYTEDLLALGIQPVGVADIASKTGFNTIVNIEPALDPTVTDVGGRQEPNLERVAELKPDLILTNVYFAKKNYDMLQDIAPTMVFDPYPPEGKNQYEEMLETFRTIADMVDRKDEAEQQLKALQTVYDEAKVKLKDAGIEGKDIVLAQLMPGQSGPTIMLFTDNSQGVNILEKIGLNNVYESGKFEQLGGTATNVEALTNLEQAEFIYMDTDSSGGLEAQLQENAVWKGLEFVKQNRVYPLDRQIWGYGGPISAKLLVQETVKALMKQ